MSVVGLVVDVAEVVFDVLLGVILVDGVVLVVVLDVPTLVTVLVLIRLWGPSVFELMFVLVCSATNRQQT